MSNCDFLAVADDSEILDAHTKVMREAREEGNKNLALTMASVTAYPFDELKLCAVTTKKLNFYSINKLGDTRTAESWERQRIRKEQEKNILLFFPHKE